MNMTKHHSSQKAILNIRRLQVRNALYFFGFMANAGVLFFYARAIISSDIFLWTVISFSALCALVMGFMFILNTLKAKELNAYNKNRTQALLDDETLKEADETDDNEAYNDRIKTMINND